MEETADATERSEDSATACRDRSLVLTSVVSGVTGQWPLGRRMVFGRGADVTHAIDLPRVSRRHAEIVRQGPIVTIRDLGSTNGTFVDARRVEHAVLDVGAMVRMGQYLAVVEASGPNGPPAHYSEIAPGLYGGASMSRVFEPLARGAARSQLSILLVGETGAGKERFAAAVHSLSGRHGPFHAINCAAIAPALAERELFGHVRGAYTGAHAAGDGHLRAAHGGTLFLDELEDLPPPVQAKLLRVLETRTVVPVGSTQGHAVDVRIVGALQRPPAELVELGVLRQDLVARLSGFVVRIPPLRERRADVPPLFSHFVRANAGPAAPALSVKLVERLCLHDWPNNVRELETFARRLLAVHGAEPRLRLRHAAPFLPEIETAALETTGQRDRGDHDRQRLLKAIEVNGGNVKRAAAEVGISRQRAYRLMGDAVAAPSKANGNGKTHA